MKTWPVTLPVLAVLGIAAAAPPEIQGQGFAVVELFTSEGCSSCPPADKLLSALVHEAERDGKPVHALSFHVDYWNYLGWKDPFSREEFTDRQRAYGEVLSARVYTPQIVVNGEREFVGSDARRTREAVKDALAAKSPVQVEVHSDWDAATRKVTVVAKVDGGVLVDRILNIALVESGIEVPVGRGENKGRRLVHDHVVRDFRAAVPDREGKAETILKLPAGMMPEKSGVIAYVQDRASLRILGAAAMDFTK